MINDLVENSKMYNSEDILDDELVNLDEITSNNNNASDEFAVDLNEENFTSMEDAVLENPDLDVVLEENNSQKLNVLNSVNFSLKCEIGEVSLSFNEVANLKIGDSLEFIKWPGKVKLRLNNLIFAEGYLVEIDGMLGVKITNRYDL